MRLQFVTINCNDNNTYAKACSYSVANADDFYLISGILYLFYIHV